MRRRSLLLIGLALVLPATLAAACQPTAPATTSTTSSTTTTSAMPSSGCATPGLATTVAYRALPGVPANSVSLDIHAPAKACRAPVVMWVHGGGYQKGDKANGQADKIRLFNSKGWIFISVNYRLTVAGDLDSAHFPDHYDDVAAGVSWVHRSIARWGGDPTKVALLGHSAGADIVSNVADNPRYLARTGLGLDALVCAGPLDTEGFDKAAADAAEKPQWVEALGNDPNYVRETSATQVATAGTHVPPTIGVYRGTAGRQRIETAYLDRLHALGVPATRIDARTLSHAEVTSRIGAPGDTVMTPPLVAFLTGCFR